MKLPVLILSASFIFFSCRPTVLLQDGKTKYFKETELNKIAVVAFPGELLDVRVFENTVAGRIQNSKNAVTAGYEIFIKEAEIPSDAVSIRESLISKGYQSVIEIKLVSIRNVETSTESDYPTRREYRIMDDTNYSKLIQEYGKREEKGATFEDVKVKMDFRVVDLTQEEPQVIWSARTETSNPKDAKNVAVGMTNKVLPALKKAGILVL